MSDGIPNVYREDGRWVFRASSFGNCDANLVRSALGITPELPPGFILDAMDQSSGHEQPILDAVKARGIEGHKFKYLDEYDVTTMGYHWHDGQPEVELDGPGWVIRCHPDAMAQFFIIGKSNLFDQGEQRVVEIKALKRASASMLEKDAYRWQFSIEMLATKMPGLIVVGWKDQETGELIIDEENELDLTVAKLDKPPFSRGQVRKRAAMLVEKIKNKDLDCTIRQFPCGFWQEHDKEQGIWAEQVTELEDPMLMETAMLYYEFDRTEKEAKKAREQARNDMIKLLKATSTEPVTPGKYRVGPVKFEYVSKQMPGKVDAKKLKPETIADMDANRGKGYASEYVQGVEIDG